MLTSVTIDHHRNGATIEHRTEAPSVSHALVRLDEGTGGGILHLNLHDVASADALVIAAIRARDHLRSGCRLACWLTPGMVIALPQMLRCEIVRHMTYGGRADPGGVLVRTNKAAYRVPMDQWVRVLSLPGPITVDPVDGTFTATAPDGTELGPFDDDETAAAALDDHAFEAAVQS